MISEQRLAEIRTRCENATRGPWIDLTAAWNAAQAEYYKRTKRHYHGPLPGARKLSSKAALVLIVVNEHQGEPIDIRRFPAAPDWYDFKRIVANPYDQVVCAHRGGFAIEGTCEGDAKIAQNDRAFIAAARSDIPDLLDEIERLSKENSELHRKLDRATGLAGMA